MSHMKRAIDASDAIEKLRNSDVMAHLLDSLADGKDIGHYGRLVFAMVGHHFLSEDELLEQLTQDPSCDEHEARSLVHQVKARDYNPPRRERILEWQQRQDFPICPNPDDPRACNVYRDLQFPEDVYEDIEHFYEETEETQETQETDAA
jgi:hypothetical protein